MFLLMDSLPQPRRTLKGCKYRLCDHLCFLLREVEADGHLELYREQDGFCERFDLGTRPFGQLDRVICSAGNVEAGPAETSFLASVPSLIVEVASFLGFAIQVFRCTIVHDLQFYWV